MDCRQIAQLIDHSLLQPNATDDDLKQACEIAKRFHVACLIVKPYQVHEAVRLMSGSGIPVGTTISFPHGANAPRAKVYEAELAIEDGAKELDMVANIGAARSGDWRFVAEDIAGVVKAAQKNQALVKVIIEACFLNKHEKVRMCQIVKDAGAQFVKSTTGYGSWGAKADDIRLMRSVVGPEFGVKASGGIRTLDALIELVSAGATRIGTSSTLAIMEECQKRLGL